MANDRAPYHMLSDNGSALSERLFPAGFWGQGYASQHALSLIISLSLSLSLSPFLPPSFSDASAGSLSLSVKARVKALVLSSSVRFILQAFLLNKS